MMPFTYGELEPFGDRVVALKDAAKRGHGGGLCVRAVRSSKTCASQRLVCVEVVSDLSRQCIAIRTNVPLPEYPSAKGCTGCAEFRWEANFPIDATVGHDGMTGCSYGEPR